VELAASNAPLALVLERLTGASPETMSLIAIVATLNGIVVQIIMASRVLYGLASYRELPAILSKVDQKTRTPLVATALATAMVLVLALLVPLHDLAEITARLALVVFAAVNVSLHRHQASRHRLPGGGLRRANLDAMGRSRGVRPFAGAGRVDHPARMTQPRSFPLPPFDVDQGCSARNQEF
jgi:amino acid transporter